MAIDISGIVIIATGIVSDKLVMLGLIVSATATAARSVISIGLAIISAGFLIWVAIDGAQMRTIIR